MKSRLRQVQAPIEDAVRARGGAVLGRFQSAYNGVKIRMAADRARELLAVPGVVALHPVRVYRPDNTHGVPESAHTLDGHTNRVNIIRGGADFRRRA